MNMVKLVDEKPVGKRIHLKFEDLISICPFRGDEDRTDFELSYTLGQVRIDAKRLEARLASEKRNIPMEMIPVEILNYCIQYCLHKGQGTGMLKDAAPEEVEIISTSGSATPGKGKEWGMKVSLKFKREPLRP